MTDQKFEFVGSGYLSTADIPKDEDLYYHCLICNGLVLSSPKKNGGCKCGNVFIDKDYWRLDIEDLSKMEVVRAI